VATADVLMIAMLQWLTVCVDTVMMMSSYSDAVVIRHPQPGAVAVSGFLLFQFYISRIG